MAQGKSRCFLMCHIKSASDLSPQTSKHISVITKCSVKYKLLPVITEILLSFCDFVAVNGFLKRG